MNIKTLKTIALLIVFSISLVGCHDLLNEPKENEEKQKDTDYTIHENMILPMRGVYQHLYSGEWGGNYLIFVMGDDLNKGAIGDQEGLRTIENYNYNDKLFWMYENAWNFRYRCVFTSFSAIDLINKYVEAGANQNTADQYIAECKTVRAFLLLQICRMWGDIIIPTTSNPIDIYERPLTPKNEALQHISDLLDEAIPNLPDMHPADRLDIPGGVTKYTAYAIKALVNLELKNYQAAADATSEIIKSQKYKLEDDFYQLFKVTKGKLNRENIFEYQFSDFNQGSGDQTVNPFNYMGPKSFTAIANNVGNGLGFCEPSVKYIDFMLKRNETVRLETSVLFTPRGIDSLKSLGMTLPAFVKNVTREGDVINNSTIHVFSSGKYYVPSTQFISGRTRWASNKNWQVIRYAEILLSHAEALTKGATSTVMTADDAVNLVRRRAGLGNLSNVTLDQVLDEKFAELGTEMGIRFYDMVRHEKWNELSYEGRTFTADKMHFPYPQNQVDIIPQLRK